MDFFKKLNEKLDLGWKYTDCECPSCKKQALYNPEASTFHCINCEKLLDFEIKPENLLKNAEQQENPANIPAFSAKKRDDSSSKLAKKLLEGWTMLEECCPDCLIPLMKPRKGPAICVGCGYEWEKGRENAKKLEQIQEKPEKVEKILEKPQTNEKIQEKVEKYSENNREIEKNIDKPRQFKEKAENIYRKDNVLEKQQATLENFSEIIKGLSSFYKEKLEKACKNDSEELVQRIFKGPLKDLLNFQASFLKNYEKLKEIEKL